jgi:hypothetical protein
METPEIPVSWGELIDKITILEIKKGRLKSKSALANVQKELTLLSEKSEPAIARSDVQSLKRRLASVNELLWDIEDKIRGKEAKQEFDTGFIELARSVYKCNDDRAHIKREINVMLSSELIEEKVYTGP